MRVLRATVVESPLVLLLLLPPLLLLLSLLAPVSTVLLCTQKTHQYYQHSCIKFEYFIVYVYTNIYIYIYIYTHIAYMYQFIIQSHTCTISVLRVYYQHARISSLYSGISAIIWCIIIVNRIFIIMAITIIIIIITIMVIMNIPRPRSVTRRHDLHGNFAIIPPTMISKTTLILVRARQFQNIIFEIKVYLWHITILYTI